MEEGTDGMHLKTKRETNGTLPNKSEDNNNTQWSAFYERKTIHKAILITSDRKKLLN